MSLDGVLCQTYRESQVHWLNGMSLPNVTLHHELEKNEMLHEFVQLQTLQFPVL